MKDARNIAANRSGAHIDRHKAPPRPVMGLEAEFTLFVDDVREAHEFYRDVFAPTIKEHFERGDSYQGIRDFVRKDWKPAR